MKRYAFSALIVGAIALTASPVRAQTVDPCSVYTCMAGLSGYGGSGGAGCQAAVNFWHAAAPAGLAVYDHDGFNSGASATLRRSYIQQCKGSQVLTNAAVLNTIIATLGYVP